MALTTTMTSQVEIYTTSRLPLHCRQEYWEQLASETYTPVLATPTDRTQFSPELRIARVGDMRVGRVVSDPSRISHTSTHVSQTRSPLFFLQLQLNGESSHRQAGREAQLQAGDFTLLDSGNPYETRFERRNEMLIVGLSERKLRQHLANPEQLLCVPMRGGAGVNSVLAAFLQALWAQCAAGTAAATAPQLTRALLELINGAYAGLAPTRVRRTEMRSTKRFRTLQYIEANLCDAQLSPGTIADACGMTRRHLHRLFAEGEETVVSYILRRRLEEAARIMISPSHAGRTLNSIALDCGFNSLTAFGRAFRAKYGMTATEYRNRHTPRNGAAISGR